MKYGNTKTLIHLKGIKKASHYCEAFFVTSEGFEPPTAGAEIQCSIQLSHEAGLDVRSLDF